MKMIDIDKLKKHTQNIIHQSDIKHDTNAVAFFNGVLIYIDHYLEVFEKEDQ